MDNWEFLKWRRTLGYTQAQLADVLGVNRGTIQNWERGSTKVSKMAQLALPEIARRRKQAPTYGPVTLFCADAPLGDQPSQPSSLHCATFLSNEDALKEISRAIEKSKFQSALIIDQEGVVVWAGEELVRECQRRSGSSPPRTADLTSAPTRLTQSS